MSFTQLGLAEPLLKAIEKRGFSTPSPIQEKAIPEVLQGKDVLAAAQTGTGKTAGFGLPILQRLMEGQPVSGNNVRALILTPTRELAAQVEESIRAFSEFLPLKTAVVFGGFFLLPHRVNNTPSFEIERRSVSGKSVNYLCCHRVTKMHWVN